MTQSGNGLIVFTKKKYIVKDFYFYLYNTATGSSSWPKWPKCLKEKKVLGKKKYSVATTGPECPNLTTGEKKVLIKNVTK
jgi:hypothetical protein